MLKPRPFRSSLLVGAALAALAILVIASYRHARSRADLLIARLHEPMESYSSNPIFVRSITGHWGPSWEFHYERTGSFPVGPLTLQMSLLGHAIGSNPTDALAKLEALP